MQHTTGTVTKVTASYSMFSQLPIRIQPNLPAFPAEDSAHDAANLPPPLPCSTSFARPPKLSNSGGFVFAAVSPLSPNRRRRRYVLDTFPHCTQRTAPSFPVSVQFSHSSVRHTFHRHHSSVPCPPPQPLPSLASLPAHTGTNHTHIHHIFHAHHNNDGLHCHS